MCFRFTEVHITRSTLVNFIHQCETTPLEDPSIKPLVWVLQKERKLLNYCISKPVLKTGSKVKCFEKLRLKSEEQEILHVWSMNRSINEQGLVHLHSYKGAVSQYWHLIQLPLHHQLSVIVTKHQLQQMPLVICANQHKSVCEKYVVMTPWSAVRKQCHSQTAVSFGPVCITSGRDRINWSSHTANSRQSLERGRVYWWKRKCRHNNNLYYNH